MAFIDYRLSTSSKKSVVIPFRCWSNDQPVYILASANGWNAVEMTKVDTVDSDKQIHLYEHTVILPGDVSNIQYKFRVGEDLYLHDETHDTISDGFGGLNNTFEVRWDPIYSISIREPSPARESSAIETPSGPGSLQVSGEEPAPVGISQMPSIDMPNANDQEPHSAPSSASYASQPPAPELVSTTPGAISEHEVDGSGHTHLGKVRTVMINVMIMECRRSFEVLRTTKIELRKLCIDITKDAVRRRTLSEHLYGPTTKSEEEQEWASIYRNGGDEIVAEIQQDPSAFAADIQNRSQSVTISSMSQKAPWPQKAFNEFKLLFGFAAVAIALTALWWHKM